MVQFSAGKCPQCGGALQLPVDRDVVKCMYCGSDVVVRESIRLHVGDPNNMLALGQEALDGSNYAQAHESFSRVLEQNPEHVDAWIGKGEAAGWQSSLAKHRLEEMTHCFNKAVKISSGSDAEEATRLRVSLSALLISRALFETSVSHVIQFMTLPEALYDHIDRCEAIVPALEFAFRMDPERQEARALIVDICGRVLKSGKLTQSENSYFTEVRARYQTPEEAAAQSKSSCFVVTATMGKEDLFPVPILREFRDKILNRYGVGRKVIAWYESTGPHAASFIAQSEMRRAISFVLIVAPATIVALPVVLVQRGCTRFSKFRG